MNRGSPEPDTAKRTRHKTKSIGEAAIEYIPSI